MCVVLVLPQVFPAGAAKGGRRGEGGERGGEGGEQCMVSVREGGGTLLFHVCVAITIYCQ